MADSTFFDGLAIWFAGFVALALVVGGAVGFAVLSDDRAPPSMDDLRVHNADAVSHSVRVEVVPENGTDAVFSERIELPPDERVAFDGTTERGESYRLVVAVADREAESFVVEGPDDLCTIEVTVASTATVGTNCA